jgi:hypothetical protein
MGVGLESFEESLKSCDWKRSHQLLGIWLETTIMQESFTV